MLIELFYVVNDFCKIFLSQQEAKLIETGQRKRVKDGNMSVSEMMTIIIYIYQNNYKNLKSYYLFLIQTYCTGYFRALLSYLRFVTLMNSVLIPLYLFIHTLAKEKTEVFFINSTLSQPHHIKREKQNKIFANLIGKSQSNRSFFLVLHII